MKSKEDDPCSIDTDSLTFEDILEILEEAAFEQDLDNPYVPLNFHDED